MRFDLPEAAPVRVVVYDAVGRQVASLVDDNLPASSHSISWSGAGSAGGVYFITLNSGKFTTTQKAVFPK